jgi:MFS family permease
LRYSFERGFGQFTLEPAVTPAPSDQASSRAPAELDSTYSWVRLAAAVMLGTIGGIGMWSFVVALPAVQAEFGVPRAWASVPYTTTMIGFGIGGVVMGRISDRYGILIPVVIGAVALALGYAAAGLSQDLWQFAAAQGILIGLLGSATVFGPLLADTSRFFMRRRGLAVGICASGNYLAGTVWPPLIQHFIETVGWRSTHVGIGILCLVTMLPLAFLMRRPPPAQPAMPLPTPKSASLDGTRASRPLPPNALTLLLVVAGFACCVAMSMPQVHIVAYCGDLGYGPARGAEMLALMMGMGIISRLFSGWICDRIGGLMTLLAGSALQCLGLFLFLPFDGLVSLYVVSALFGLFQGGIVPSYAIIVREYFPSHEAGVRVGLVIFATLIGMAFGGWVSGRIYDITGSYQAAFLNGIAWNILNCAIVIYLIWRLGRPGRSRENPLPPERATPAVA